MDEESLRHGNPVRRPRSHKPSLNGFTSFAQWQCKLSQDFRDDIDLPETVPITSWAIWKEGKSNLTFIAE